MSKLYTRQAEVEQSVGDVVPLILATQYPVARAEYVEILSCDPAHVDLTRAPLPLIVQHDTQQINVGVVENVRVDNGVVRGDARFSSSPRAQQLLADIKARIVRSVSVGYEVLRRVGQMGERVIVFAWRPYEASAVSVPADPGAGFYRSIDMKDTTMSNTENTTPAAPGTRSVVGQLERDRIASLEALGRQFKDFGGENAAQECIAKGASVEDLRQILLERVGKRQAPDMGEFRPIGLTNREKSDFRIMRVVRALANPNDRRAQADAAFEFEVSEAALRAEGRSLRGGAAVTIPLEILQHGRRDLLAGTSTLGGYSVGTDMMGGSFVHLLKNKAFVIEAGATVLGGLAGHVAIPTLATSATAYWVAENVAPTEGNMTFGQIAMSPKSLGAYVDISRKLAIQSSIDVENFVRAELASQLAVEMDRVALNGAGTGAEPLGILVSTAIGTTTAGANGAAPTWAHVVELEAQVAGNNADRGALAYFMSPKARAKLKQVTRTTDAASGFIFADGGTVNGYRTFVTKQLPDTLTKGTTTGSCSAAIFGNFNDVLVAQWSGIDLLVDVNSLSTVGGTRVVAFADIDVGIRRAGSFQVIKDWIC